MRKDALASPPNTSTPGLDVLVIHIYTYKLTYIDGDKELQEGEEGEKEEEGWEEGLVL